MPARDKYHDTVVQSLEKAGWEVLDDPYTLLLETRRLYVDLCAKQDETMILVEIKVFDDAQSPITYLSNAVGQYKLYQSALRILERDLVVYMAVPSATYETLFSEGIVQQYILDEAIKLLIFDPETEEVVKWIP